MVVGRSGGRGGR
uniref:Uncharacterized protein n=1 Tax=Arundo donax TaxID=35708 RepID=A0A0A8Z7F4_ARUDO